ncbi:hypothetical protein [Hymenobacter nivis]|uniref:Uncharacterized protein n=1 Tax=Hymenobacter nivis TaxID=1850093 RepID=A0A2Z3GFN8_9BACT|nr:hypothetical protein [Hymenobacter nivis]AWM31638.1 hypothetical protein DDQ68_01825 [Hymenobacter nivis]
MLLNANLDLYDGSSCLLSYDEAERWLQGTRIGYIDEDEAMRGAAAYLHRAAQRPCQLLLNNNTALRGPWFASLDWLASAPAPFELQVFQNLA